MSKNEVIDFRNGKYQGSLLNNIPNQKGIFIDDNLNFIVSNWVNSKINSKTFIFYGHKKLNYGNWKNGKPQGFNIFRLDNSVIYSNFVNGKIQGNFFIYFQNEKFLIQAKINGENYEVVNKLDKPQQTDIKQRINQLYNKQSIDLISFLKQIQAQNKLIKFTKSSQQQYKFGIENGLQIHYDSSYNIKTLGPQNQLGQIKGIGGKYTKKTGQQGDFQNKITIKFKNNKPKQQISRIIRQSHKRALNFANYYIEIEVDSALKYIQKFIQSKILNELAQEQLYINGNNNKQQQSKGISNLDKLKKMRQQIYKSIGKGNIQNKKKQSPINKIHEDNYVKPLKYELQKNMIVGQSPLYKRQFKPNIEINGISKYQKNIINDRILKQYTQLRNQTPPLVKFQRQTLKLKYGKPQQYRNVQNTNNYVSPLKNEKKIQKQGQTLKTQQTALKQTQKNKPPQIQRFNYRKNLDL